MIRLHEPESLHDPKPPSKPFFILCHRRSCAFRFRLLRASTKSRQPCASTIKTRTDNVRFQDTTYVDDDSLVVASAKVQRLKMKWTETESLKPLRGKQKY